MFLLDTNVVSELRRARSGKADPNVVAWAAGKRAAQLYLSAITVLELEWGVRAKARQDELQGLLLHDWLHAQVLPAFKERILAVDTSVALACAGLHVPDRRPERDALIAATALAHGLTLVSRNLRDLQAPGLTVVNPWQSSSA